jgi:hypothetical protein
METKARATASVVARGLVGVTVMLGLAVGSAAVAGADPVMQEHIKGTGVCL